MQILKKIILFFIIILLTGCSPLITRYGYKLRDIPNKDSYFDCDIPIKKNFQYSKSEADIVGKIKSGDPGIALECGENYILSIFRQEACARGANLINIIYERKPNTWSSCYRAKAEFLRLKNKLKAKTIPSDAAYAQ